MTLPLRRLVTIVSVFICTTSFVQKPKTYVYICDSKGSVAYHLSRNCSGLSHCKHDIIKTTEDSAVNYYGRRPCKICGR